MYLIYSSLRELTAFDLGGLTIKNLKTKDNENDLDHD